MLILLTAIEPVMFFSRCFVKAKLLYGSLELEVACFVWACKRLCITLYLNCKPNITVLTNYNAIKGIVNKTKLDTTSIDWVN